MALNALVLDAHYPMVLSLAINKNSIANPLVLVRHLPSTETTKDQSLVVVLIVRDLVRVCVWVCEKFNIANKKRNSIEDNHEVEGAKVIWIPSLIVH